jgi:hypothetical protein
MMPGTDHRDVRTTLTLDDEVARRLGAERRRSFPKLETTNPAA